MRLITNFQQRKSREVNRIFGRKLQKLLTTNCNLVVENRASQKRERDYELGKKKKKKNLNFAKRVDAIINNKVEIKKFV